MNLLLGLCVGFFLLVFLFLTIAGAFAQSQSEIPSWVKTNAVWGNVNTNHAQTNVNYHNNLVPIILRTT